MMAFLLILFYGGLFSWWLMRSNSLNNIKIPRVWLLIAFLAKLVSGVVYGLIYHDYFGGGDTVLYLKESQRIYNTFATYPSYYIQSLFSSGEVITPEADVFTYPSSSLFWKDLGTYMVVHLNALIYPLTGGYYNVHIAFIAMLGMFAGIRFYRVFENELQIPSILLFSICFFLPSLLFWTSGLHKDILVYYGLSYVLSGLYQATKVGKVHWSSVLWGLLVIGIFRYYLLVLLCPAILGYWWSSKGKRLFYTKYLAVYLACACIAAIFIPLAIDHSIWEILANKQAAFLAENGSTSFYQAPLDPSFLGILSALPEAWFNVAWRPFLWECADFWQGLASLEIIFFWLVFIASFFYMDSAKMKKPLVAFLVYYAISNWLLIGLLVSNTGTIVRYRAIALSFFIIVMAQLIDYKKLSMIFNRKKKKAMNLVKNVDAIRTIVKEDEKENVVMNS